MRKLGVWLACFLSIATAAQAAIVYLPIQYQYGDRDKFYYGGSDPAVIERGVRVEELNAYANPPISNLPTRVYSDLLPYQSNAAIFGFTANDARMAAYNAVPRYFRMADVRASGHLQSDGTVVVPPTAPGTIEIKPYVRPTAPPARVIVIPKSMLTPPVQSIAAR